MTDKYTAAEWAAMEGGHDITPAESKFSFLQELHESRMTKDNGNSQKLTYTDCGERMYLTLLALETMRQFPDFKSYVERYAKKTSGFETFKYYRIMGTDLYNFIYFLVGDAGAQTKLKDPEAAALLKQKTNLPTADINRYIRSLANGTEPTSVSSMFLRIESAINVTNADYKAVRRAVMDWAKQNRQDKRLIATRLIFAVRAKLRSSDIIEDFEKWAAIKNMETASVVDPEPTVSVPDINTRRENLSLYRYLVGDKNLALTKKFLDQTKNGNAASSNMLAAYKPAVELLDDIVQAGPAYVQQLRALHNRAKKGR